MKEELQLFVIILIFPDKPPIVNYHKHIISVAHQPPITEIMTIQRQTLKLTFN